MDGNDSDYDPKKEAKREVTIPRAFVLVGLQLMESDLTLYVRGVSWPGARCGGTHFNPRASETGRSLGVWVQPGLLIEFHTSQDYTMRPCLTVGWRDGVVVRGLEFSSKH